LKARICRCDPKMLSTAVWSPVFVRIAAHVIRTIKKMNF
jgi:hypothetical protein